MLHSTSRAHCEPPTTKLCHLGKASAACSYSWFSTLFLHLSISPLSSGKMTDMIWMPFETDGQVDTRMCSVGGAADCPTEKAILGVKMGRHIATDGKFVALLLSLIHI